MWFIGILLMCVLAVIADPISVDTPPFDIVDNELRVYLSPPPNSGLQYISSPGAKYSPEDFKEPPGIAAPPNAVRGSPYIIIMITPDGQGTSSLLWLEANVTISTINNLDYLTPQTNGSPRATYHGPDPPPNIGPHRYTVLLFNQPETFTIPPQFSKWFAIDGRKFATFDFPAFVAATGLEKPIAANFFLSELILEKRDITNRSSDKTGRATDAIPNDVNIPTSTRGAWKFLLVFWVVGFVVVVIIVGVLLITFWRRRSR